MWATTPTLISLHPNPTPFPLTHPKTQPPAHLKTTTFTQQKKPHPFVAASSSKDIGGLGQAVLTALNSSPKPTNQKPKSGSKESEEKKGKKELSGSDILWALQKANAKKAHGSNKKQQKRQGAVGSLKRDDQKRLLIMIRSDPLL